MKITRRQLRRLIREAHDPAALARTRELYDMINALSIELESLQADLESFIAQEMSYGYSDPSTARYDYEDAYPDKMERMRYIEMTIEDAYSEIELLGDLPYD